ncbi:hypothetical protein C8R45DRAFT_923388 [Mycena sanguinolenta]|nr:hypothetical protein C8R45DRAFT_923388 [Mycena sanguinolenta]
MSPSPRATIAFCHCSSFPTFAASTPLYPTFTSRTRLLRRRRRAPRARAFAPRRSVFPARRTKSYFSGGRYCNNSPRAPSRRAPRRPALPPSSRLIAVEARKDSVSAPRRPSFPTLLDVDLDCAARMVRVSGVERDGGSIHTVSVCESPRSIVSHRIENGNARVQGAFADNGGDGVNGNGEEVQGCESANGEIEHAASQTGVRVVMDTGLGDKWAQLGHLNQTGIVPECRAFDCQNERENQWNKKGKGKDKYGKRTWIYPQAQVKLRKSQPN